MKNGDCRGQKGRLGPGRGEPGASTECVVSEKCPGPGRPLLTLACGGQRERHTVLGQSAPVRSTTWLHNNPERNFTQNKSLVTVY